MPQPKPLNNMYKLIGETKKDLKSNIQQLLDYATKGDPNFIKKIQKVNWNSLPSKDVLVMVLMILSYGLKTKKKVFEDYIKDENKNLSVSLFRSMLDGNGNKIKASLNKDSLTNALETIFTESKDLNNTLENIHKRAIKINSKDFSNEERAQIEALINSIIQGKNIEPVLTPEE